MCDSVAAVLRLEGSVKKKIVGLKSLFLGAAILLFGVAFYFGEFCIFLHFSAIKHLEFLRCEGVTLNRRFLLFPPLVDSD